MDCIRLVRYARRRMTGSHDYIRHFFRDFKQDGLGRWKEKCDQKQYAMDIKCGGDCDGGHKTELDAGIASMDMATLAFLLCFLKKVMPQGMGEGDIWTLMVLPMYVTAAQMWEGILYSMFLMIPIAAWQYWRKKDKTAGIPYLPFLWMGMMLVGRNMLYGVY